jgi:hypothetical protein
MCDAVRQRRPLRSGDAGGRARPGRFADLADRVVGRAGRFTALYGLFLTMEVSGLTSVASFSTLEVTGLTSMVSCSTSEVTGPTSRVAFSTSALAGPRCAVRSQNAGRGRGNERSGSCAS